MIHIVHYKDTAVWGNIALSVEIITTHCKLLVRTTRRNDTQVLGNIMIANYVIGKLWQLFYYKRLSWKCVSIKNIMEQKETKQWINFKDSATSGQKFLQITSPNPGNVVAFLSRSTINSTPIHVQCTTIQSDDALIKGIRLVATDSLT